MNIIDKFLLAAEQGQVDNLKLILKSGALNNYNCVDDNGNTALHIAIINNQVDIVDALLEDDKINPNEPNSKGYPPLFSAIEYKRTEIICKLLQSSKTRVNIRDRNGYNSLIYAVYYGLKDICVAILKSQRIDPNQTSRLGVTALKMRSVMNY